MNTNEVAGSRLSLPLICVLLGCVLLAACGPGGDPGAVPGLAPGNPSLVPSGPADGIEGTGIGTTETLTKISTGPIASTSGLTIDVNGETWSIANASITIEGEPGTPADLQPGMIVMLKGTEDPPGVIEAESVVATILVRGPIASLDGASRHFTILGQAIVGDDGTILDVPGASFDALYEGQIVSVSGFAMAQGFIDATRISLPPPEVADQMLVVGQVLSIDRSVARLTIDGLTVDGTGAQVIGWGGISFSLFSGGPSAGDWVTVIGRRFTDDGALDAETIHRYSVLSEDGDDISVTAVNRVWRIVSPTEFDLWGGLRVVVPAGVEIANGPVAVDAYVSVWGTIDGPGVISATFVRVAESRAPYWEIVGAVEDIRVESPDSRIVRLLGVDVRVDASTRVLSWPAGTVQTFTDIAIGDPVLVEVYENGYAFFVSRWPDRLESALDFSTVAGEYFRSIAPPDRFTIYGFAEFTVEVRPDTVFHYADREPMFDFTCDRCVFLTADEFWQRAALPKPPNSHTYIFVWGDYDGSSFFARQVWLHVAEGSPY